MTIITSQQLAQQMELMEIELSTLRERDKTMSNNYAIMSGELNQIERQNSELTAKLERSQEHVIALTTLLDTSMDVLNRGRVMIRDARFQSLNNPKSKPELQERPAGEGLSQEELPAFLKKDRPDLETEVSNLLRVTPEERQQPV